MIPTRYGRGYHIWTASQIAWFDTMDDLPRHQKNLRANSG
jgi:hypothetical protein